MSEGGEVAWLLLALTLFAGAASPGPSLALVIRHTLSSGRGAGLMVAVAHGLGVWLYALAVVFGVATLLMHLSGVMLAVQLVGMVFLCYLGAGMIRSGWGGSSDAPLISPAENAAGTDSYFRDGFLIVFLNPKIMVFFVAVFSQFLTSSQTLMAQVYAASLAGVIDAVWYALVALLVSSGRVSAWLQRYRNRLDIFFGLVLWGVSITFLYGILNAY
jgi:threonine/homoserine/homoserine lactone efflux protein